VELVLLSIPVAFIAANFRLKEPVFFTMLGFALILAAMAMLIQLIRFKDIMKYRDFSPGQNMVLGGVIGSLSGLVGIGGGIFLSPILNLSRWGDARKIAALSSFFIGVNSLAGLAGLYLSQQYSFDLRLALPLLLAVLMGAQVGARTSLRFIPVDLVKAMTAILVFFVGSRLVWKFGMAVPM
jgi:hypothetical protein